MNRISAFLILLLLASCVKVFPDVNESLIPLEEAFVFNENCPHLCWMNINPETTTIKEAIALLRNSDQIDWESIEETEGSVYVKWFNRRNKKGYVSVLIRSGSENSIVQSIRFDQLYPYNVDGFTKLLGEPDDISISLNEMDGIRSVNYALYYSSSKTFLYINNNAITTGPNSEHTIGYSYLNIDIQNNDFPQWAIDNYNNQQPWLGYGHLEEYLPGVEIP